MAGAADARDGASSRHPVGDGARCTSTASRGRAPSWCSATAPAAAPTPPTCSGSPRDLAAATGRRSCSSTSRGCSPGAGSPRRRRRSTSRGSRRWPPCARRRASGRRTPLVVGGRSAGARVACRTAEAVGAAPCCCSRCPLLPPAARADAARRETALATPARRAGAAARGRDPRGGGAGVARRVRRRRRARATAAGDAARGRRGGRRRPRACAPGAGGPDPRPTLLSAALRAVALARGE